MENKQWEKEFDNKFGENIRNCQCDCHFRPIPELPRTLCNHCNINIRNIAIKDFISSPLSTARQEERNKIREIIETKLKNDPNNPVLVAGLEYVLTILSSLQNKE